MGYLVVVTFDRSADEAIKTELSALGLNPQLTGDSGTVSGLPTNTFVGEINGSSSASIRDDIANKVLAIFKKHGVVSKIFVSVGDGWSWAIRNA